MNEQKAEYPFQEKDVRKKPDKRELRIFQQASQYEGGTRSMPSSAKKFASRFASSVTYYPAPSELPKWFLAMVEKKASVEELAQKLYERLRRMPNEENLELALLTVNEVARMKEGPDMLAKYLTTDLLSGLSEKGGTKR